MPSLAEAKGGAMAAAETGKLYSVGFVLNEAGTLLDGTPIEALIGDIDSSITNKSLCYLIVCTHPSVVAKASLLLKALKKVMLYFMGGSCKLENTLLGGNKHESQP